MRFLHRHILFLVFALALISPDGVAAVAGASWTDPELDREQGKAEASPAQVSEGNEAELLSSSEPDQQELAVGADQDSLATRERATGLPIVLIQQEEEELPEILNEPLSMADWEYILKAMDSLIADLESTAFRPAYPVADSGYWSVEDASWPKCDAETVRQRLAAIPTTIPLTYNQAVHNWINMYTQRNRAGVQRMLGMKDLYFPMIEAELDRRNLPLELKYVPIIESALNTHAVSPQGATGLWQIMYTTAKGLGLRIDTYVDERRDPYLATMAALDYLEQLHRIYDDWLMAIAAYNCGPGNVNKAIRRAGGKRNVWSIYEYLPRETRGYVPAFISSVYTFTYYQEHELTPWKSRFDYTFSDTVMLSQNMSFNFLSEQLDMSVKELKYYNPALRRDIVPGNAGAYPLRLPYDKAMAWVSKEAEILEAQKAQSKEVKTLVAAAESAPASSQSAQNRLLYTVKSGDTLWGIARAHPGNTIEGIARLNGMSSRSTLRPGQTLKLNR